ncbi:hypothetical protein Hanom_Chr01g00064731 [Helianthus anomalus]
MMLVLRLFGFPSFMTQKKHPGYGQSGISLSMLIKLISRNFETTKPISYKSSNAHCIRNKVRKH